MAQGQRRHASPRLAATLGSLLLVAVAFALEWDNTSPGALARVHGRESDLQGPESCASCHGDAFGGASMDGACLECHEAIAAQIDAHEGLHGIQDVSGCARCHEDHHGEGFPLVNRVAFARAGVPDVESFEHAGLGFALEGLHDRLECVKCHENVHADPLPKDAMRFGGLSETCVACHEDEHKGSYGNDCAHCHGQEQAFDDVAGFAHTEICPLVGSHADVECIECHADDSPFAVSLLVHEETRPPRERECVSCHESPHRDTFLEGVADERGLSDEESTCRGCHAAAHADFAALPTEPVAKVHDASGFALVGPHAGLRCDQCHLDIGTAVFAEGGAEAFAARFPGRTEDACVACHADPHGGQFDPVHDGRCLDCHGREDFHPTTFDVERHAATAFPLEGAHAEAECQACHEQPQPEVPREFVGTTSQCKDCHASPHRASFVARAAVALAVAEPAQSCAACHDTKRKGFLGRPLADGEGWHAASGFPLEKPHAGLECKQCHEGFGLADAVRWLADGTTDVPVRDPDTCQACHEDVHRGQFADGPFADGGCLQCHARTRFVPARFDLAQHALCDFPLRGSHQAVGCDRCHEVPAPGALRVFADTPEDCASCHVDVHGGLFDRDDLPRRVEGREGCARCHTEEAFRSTRAAPVAFDHALWADYPLQGAHARASCDGCHVAPRGTDFGSVTFGSVRGTTCVACHDDVHLGQFDVDGATDCERCHTVAESFAELVFDHDTTSFPLDARHVGVACDACHMSVDVPGYGPVTRYRPLGNQCNDCHAAGTVK
ncbi:MAG: hypothetical protein H6825_16370 [Planctomycetes bacterium]|nr:hypothetical protein [Planctomycetota bacterium]